MIMQELREAFKLLNDGILLISNTALHAARDTAPRIAEPAKAAANVTCANILEKLCDIDTLVNPTDFDLTAINLSRDLSIFCSLYSGERIFKNRWVWKT